ncbi:MAG: aminoacetone oxidase family FAD-binding enzyme [candidate division Zixibacteria bacterium]|nr:aminoacetone oxidase family FAD-binding enzyme [candidate division Zixibacteria bacterium]
MSSRKCKSMLPIAIIGGGPSGMMAAIVASKNNDNVIIFNKNPLPGKKISAVPAEDFYYSEKLPVKKMAAKFKDKSNFVSPIFKAFGYTDLVKMFKKMKLNLELDSFGHFKANGVAGDGLSKALLEEALKCGVIYKKSSRVTDIYLDKSKISGVLVNNSRVSASAVILASGSFSSPKYGATKDGYEIANKFGHRINELKPALVDLTTREKYGKDLAGKTVDDVKISIYYDGKQAHCETGTIRFTPSGISGPVILDYSSRIIDKLKDTKVEVRLDFMPNEPRETFESWLTKEIISRHHIHIGRFLSRYFNDTVIKALSLESRIKLDKSIAHITTLERKSLIHAIKDFRMSIRSHKPFNNTRGVVGGVSIDEIDPKTCESKLIKSLYFAGDVIDVLGPYGGYNMQFAFSSGFVAGRAASGDLS